MDGNIDDMVGECRARIERLQSELSQRPQDEKHIRAKIDSLQTQIHKTLAQAGRLLNDTKGAISGCVGHRPQFAGFPARSLRAKE